MQSYTLTNLLVTLEHGPSKGWCGVHLLHDNASFHKCAVVKSFLASEKVKVFNHQPYSPDLSPCDFFLFPRLNKMLSGNKYMSRSSLGSAIYQCLQQIPKEDYLSAFRDWMKRLQKMYFSKGGILWRFVINICLIKRSTEVIRTQWQNFLQDPRITDNQVNDYGIYILHIITIVTWSYALHQIECILPGSHETLTDLSLYCPHMVFII